MSRAEREQPQHVRRSIFPEAFLRAQHCGSAAAGLGDTAALGAVGFSHRKNNQAAHFRAGASGSRLKAKGLPPRIWSEVMVGATNFSMCSMTRSVPR